MPTPPATIIGMCSTSKPGRIVGRSVVQFADGFDRDPFCLQRVTPAGDAAGIGHGVVPQPDLVDVAPGGETGACRHADRRRCIGVGEPQSPPGEPVEVRGLGQGMGCAAHRPRLVLVGHDDEEVRAHRGNMTRSAASSIFCRAAKTVSRSFSDMQSSRTAWRARMCGRASSNAARPLSVMDTDCRRWSFSSGTTSTSP